MEGKGRRGREGGGEGEEGGNGRRLCERGRELWKRKMKNNLCDLELQN